MITLSYSGASLLMLNTETKVKAYLCDGTWFVVRPGAAAAIMCATVEIAYGEVSKS